MPNWVQAYDGSYWQLSHFARVYVAQWNPEVGSTDSPADGKWWVFGDGQPIRGATQTTGFQTQAQALSALATAVAALGGAL